VDYISGFSKINNRDRFAPDRFADEGSRFDRPYRPIGQIDQERLAYLYPERIDAKIRDRYMNDLESMIGMVRSRGVAFIAVKPPIPERVHRLVPGEAEFDDRLRAMLARHDVAFSDFSHTGNEDKYFYDTDHLNQSGVLHFFETSLKGLLTKS
jgi:hypothetical protein